MEIHGTGQWDDVRDVRGPCQRCGPQSLPRKKSAFLSQQGRNGNPHPEELDEQALRNAICSTGYEAGEIRKEPYKKRGLFG